MARETLPNGTDALMAELSLKEIMRLIETTCRWVDPATFKLLPVWYPEYARKAYFYKSNWSEPQMNTNRETRQTVHKQEGNLYANKSLTHALGLRSEGRKGWSCYHLWGVDDAFYQESNSVVQDRRYYSCVANMVLLPTPLKAFTDTVPDVKGMLRLCARNLYDWECDHDSQKVTNDQLDMWSERKQYPGSWPKIRGAGAPLGVMPISEDIRATARRRWDKIRKDLKTAGSYFPREEVLDALLYWKLDPTEDLVMVHC